MCTVPCLQLSDSPSTGCFGTGVKVMDCWGTCVAAEPLFPLRRSTRDWSKELIWTPTSEQQFRKLHLHFACRRSQLQLRHSCCTGAASPPPCHCKAPMEKGKVRAFSHPDPRLSSVLAFSSCSNGFEDRLPVSCSSLALSREVLSWPWYVATLSACLLQWETPPGTWGWSLSQHA